MKRSHGEAVSVEMEVPFHDVDALKVVWHGHYYKYAEIGRTAFFRAKGIDFGVPAVQDHGTFVIETRCRYAFPLRYGERFRVDTWVDDTENRITLGFEIFNLAQNRRSAHGHVILATVDAEGNLLLETPDAIRRLLR